MTSDATEHYTARARLFGGNRMKLGVMAFNCSHGSTITTVPEAWKLNWNDTVEIAQAVDRSGMEAILPVGRWRGYGGQTNFNATTFESFTWASALGALTNYVTVLATCHVPVMNAGGSPAAQDFTTHYCDMNFVHLKDRTNLETGRKEIAHLKDIARSHGRETRIWIHAYAVCRDTEKAAKDYLRHYVYDKGDWEAAGNLLRIFGLQSASYDPKTLEEHKAHFIAGHGGYPLVGTPDQIADELGRLSDIGVDGCLISWVNYKDELTQWNAEVLPLLVQSGLRQPFPPAAQPKTLDRPQGMAVV